MHKLLFLIIITFLLANCDNTKDIEESRKSPNHDVKNLKTLKDEYSSNLDSIKYEISEIEFEKQKIAESIEYFKAEIYNIIKHSHLDHVIIGSKNLNKTQRFFSDTLGFAFKKGKKHDNGISNIFVEFVDSSEIEIITVDQGIDKLSKYYKSKIDKGLLGLQFALRTNTLDTLFNLFQKIECLNFWSLERDSFFSN